MSVICIVNSNKKPWSEVISFNKLIHMNFILLEVIDWLKK